MCWSERKRTQCLPWIIPVLYIVKVRRFCCSLYSCRKLIIVIIGKWSDDVRLDTMVISGEDVCCGVVFGTLVGVLCSVLCSSSCL